MATWTELPSYRTSRSWVGEISGGFVPISAEERYFRFEHPGTIPTSDTHEEVASSMRRAFEAELAEYFDRIDALAKERGLEATPEKRPRYDPTDEKAWRRFDHFAWLARVQIDEESCAQVAREADRDETAVQKVVVDTAALIGLMLRPRQN